MLGGDRTAPVAHAAIDDFFDLAFRERSHRSGDKYVKIAVRQMTEADRRGTRKARAQPIPAFLREGASSAGFNTDIEIGDRRPFLDEIARCVANGPQGEALAE